MQRSGVRGAAEARGMTRLINPASGLQRRRCRGVTLAPAEQDGAEWTIAGGVRRGGLFCPTSKGEIRYQRGQRRLYSAGKRRVDRSRRQRLEIDLLRIWPEHQSHGCAATSIAIAS